jgi:hypothetical protein
MNILAYHIVNVGAPPQVNLWSPRPYSFELPRLAELRSEAVDSPNVTDELRSDAY